MYIKVKAIPLSKKESIEKISDDTFTVYVKEPPKRNLANKRIIEIMAREFGIPIGKVRIINGHRSRSKILNIDID
jgi:uncharacterized protein (TIGR00251 family)